MSGPGRSLPIPVLPVSDTCLFDVVISTINNRRYLHCGSFFSQRIYVSMEFENIIIPVINFCARCQGTRAAS